MQSCGHKSPVRWSLRCAVWLFTWTGALLPAAGQAADTRDTPAKGPGANQAQPAQPAPGETKPAGYCVVVSRATEADRAWQAVTAALVKKHGGKLVTYDQDVSDSLAELKREYPRYACFVARSSEATEEYVAKVSRLSRRLNDDPYTDLAWGIVTGYDAADALRIAEESRPLVIERVAAGTEVELSACREGLWYCELNQGRMVRKAPGEPAKEEKGPPDTTAALAETLTKYQAQLFVTSGHATERDWQIGFRYRNGQFRSQAGELFGVDTKGTRLAIKSDSPKVYLPVGNCLMGHIDGPDAMALAFMHSAGVRQMIGYTVPTWYGYGGWGLLDYFVEQPGRFNMSEAFWANRLALEHRLETYFPGVMGASGEPQKPAQLSAAAKAAGLVLMDASGLVHDRDVVAFYGDPAWDARLASGPLRWEQALREEAGTFRLEIKPLAGEKTYRPVNMNGSQRGGRPIVQFLPRRIQGTKAVVLEGSELKPVIGDSFVLVPLPSASDANKTLRVVFRAAE